MSVALPSRFRIILVLVIALATISFHYGWIIKPSEGMYDAFHAIHGRLCYIPIILGAIWFGIRGGVAVAAFIIALTLPYALTGGGGHGGSTIGEFTEMVFYMAIGLMAGVLIELQRRERTRSEVLTKELARQEHLSSLGQMAAGLAHEIKNPLGSIKGSAEILEDDFPEGSKKREMLQVLSQETNRLDHVVEDFLNFARPRPLERRPTQINRVLDGVVAQIEVDTRAQRVEIVKDLADDIPSAEFDAEKLHQVFLNLSLNALNAMPDGGRLEIESRLMNLEGEPHIAVTFQDDGQGIDSDDLEKIFDPFFTTSESGTGLGLSISHMIVQNHGGHIDVRRNGDKGTRIRILLPIKQKK